MNKITLLGLFLLWMTVSVCAEPFQLMLYEANLPEVLRILAKLNAKNVIISPKISGNISLQLHDTTPEYALDALVFAAGLAKENINNVMFIAPQGELRERHQEMVQWQESHEADAPRRLHFWRLNYANAKEMATVLQLNPENKKDKFAIDERTNSLYLYHTQEKIKYADKVIKKLDVPIHQILVKVRIESIDEDMEHQLGIQFGQQIGKTEEISSLSQNHPGQYALKLARLASGASLDVTLSLLERTGRAELISSPSLYAANRQSASIEAGEEVPYQQTSENGGTTVVFKKAVLGLHVTPEVLPHNQILLQLKINQDRPGKQLILGMPIIATRHIRTNVLVQSGETIVLGGIEERDREKGVQHVPVLGHLPLFGKLFRETSRLEKRRNLLIFVTPTIVA